MELVAVNSSNIAAIGYLPDVCLMRVNFRDGTQYDWVNISAQAHAELMAAPSKGAHLSAKFPPGVRCAQEDNQIKLREPQVAACEVPLDVTGANEIAHAFTATQKTLLETFGEDSCCSPRLAKGPRIGDTWTCPKCGTEWRARMVDNVKAWNPDEVIMTW